MYQHLYWNTKAGDETKFITDTYSENICWLQMNNFPDEALWTLFYKGESINIEDTPKLWKINYANKKLKN